MQSAPIAPATDDTAPPADVEIDPTDDTLDADPPATDVLVNDELLIEEISIDGMCGVY